MTLTFGGIPLENKSTSVVLDGISSRNYSTTTFTPYFFKRPRRM